MRSLITFFLFFLAINFSNASQSKDYFELLDIELQNSMGDKSKVNRIIERETIKYNKTGEKKYLLSSKFAKIFVQNPNNINLLSENYEIYSLGIQDFPCLYIRILYNLSIIFSNNNLPDKATYYIDKAILEAKKQNHTLYLAYLYHIKGNIFSEKKDYKNSTIFFLEALKNYKELKETTYIAAMYNKLGIVLYEQKQYAQASQYFQSALQIIKSNEKLSAYGKYTLNYIKKSIANNYHKTGNFDIAEKNFIEALDGFKNEPTYEGELVSTVKELSELYVDFSKTEKNKNLMAYLKATETKLTDTNSKITVADLLLQYYFNIDNKVETQNYIKKLVELNLQKEKELGEENKKITDILNNKVIHDFDSKMEDQRKKYFWVVITSILTAGIFVILFFSLRDKRKRERLLFEKQKLIDEQNIIIMEHNMKVQDEKIKNLHLNLNLKNKTEKAFLYKLKSMRSSSRNIEEILKDLYFNMYNLLEIDKKNIDFTEESYNQNKLLMEKLAARFPTLSEKEHQLCIYIKLGLTPKEISILEKTTNGNIRVKKTHLKSKLGLTTTDNIDDFLKNI